MTVKAIDKATGKEQQIRIQNNNLSKEEIERMKSEAELHEKEDRKTEERLKKLNQIDGTIYQVEKFVEDYKDKNDILSEEDKTYFNNKVEDLKKFRNGDVDLSNADNLINEVNQRLVSVGSKVYSNNQQGGANPFGFGNFNGSNFNDIFANAGQSAPKNENKQNDVEEV